MLTNSDNVTLDINLELPETPTDKHNTDVIHAETSKLKAFFALLKFRLSALVVFSSAIGYALGVEQITDWKKFAVFCFSSFIITGSANTINQVIEKEYDKNMKRTKTRPLPTGVISPAEGIVFATILAIIGGALLVTFVNSLTAALALLSLFLYAFVYTPSKRISSSSVFIGAFPGAFPPLIGWVASNGEITHFALILFAIQFLWQFPHFWAIAWLGNDDYVKAGFKMLPSGGKTLRTSIQILMYTLFLLPVGLMPYVYGMSGKISAIVIFAAGLLFLVPAWLLVKKGDNKSALFLMFSSFFYLPIVQLALLFDKL
ncbi:heme o synthase [Bernardetia sp.]|uniref:heme o synthase n=1 Tax=Bernardetia sp. TaxID=1937974 RepID=UPI0025C14A18|nr:heme o synthase [Bernardetia sp.]